MMAPHSNARRSRASLCILASLALIAASRMGLAAAPMGMEPAVRLRGPRRGFVPLFGLTGSGADYDPSGLAGPIGIEALETLLAPARQAGSWRLWRIEPGRWPVVFCAARIDPDSDGKNLDFGPTDALAKAAANAGVELVPVLDEADLARLGPSAVGQTPSPPRACFLSALAERYDGDGTDDLPAPEAARITIWQIRTSAPADPAGSAGGEMAQFIADAAAIRAGNFSANIKADIGEFSTAADPEALKRIGNFCTGPARPLFHGLSVALVLERPSLAEAGRAFALLRAATGGLPVWVHAIRTGPGFSEGPAQGGETPGAWGLEETRAAYASALGAYCLASVLGGAVFWDEAPSTDTLAAAGRPPSPMALAAGRLARLAKPYYRAQDTGEGFVHVLTFHRDPEPEWRVV